MTREQELRAKQQARQAALCDVSFGRDPNERSKWGPLRVKGVTMERVRLYHVVAINERTGKKEYFTATPEPHKEACTILSKQIPRRPNSPVRIQLEEVQQ